MLDTETNPTDHIPTYLFLRSDSRVKDSLGQTVLLSKGLYLYSDSRKYFTDDNLFHVFPLSSLVSKSSYVLTDTEGIIKSVLVQVSNLNLNSPSLVNLFNSCSDYVKEGKVNLSKLIVSENLNISDERINNFMKDSD